MLLCFVCFFVFFFSTHTTLYNKESDPLVSELQKYEKSILSTKSAENSVEFRK